jgi:hypothetical protein
MPMSLRKSWPKTRRFFSGAIRKKREIYDEHEKQRTYFRSRFMQYTHAVLMRQRAY